jgi:hypothetical protein
VDEPALVPKQRALVRAACCRLGFVACAHCPAVCTRAPPCHTVCIATMNCKARRLAAARCRVPASRVQSSRCRAARHATVFVPTSRVRACVVCAPSDGTFAVFECGGGAWVVIAAFTVVAAACVQAPVRHARALDSWAERGVIMQVCELRRPTPPARVHGIVFVAVRVPVTVAVPDAASVDGTAPLRDAR